MARLLFLSFLGSRFVFFGAIIEPLLPDQHLFVRSTVHKEHPTAWLQPIIEWLGFASFWVGVIYWMGESYTKPHPKKNAKDEESQ
ncbi:hypothetical protein PG996_015533 [Apiospora saccharicola]|uniref:Uncharacterized protein n=1 Tax=Apiospora saccharicola TaxID=335842 RepID=A0ABR1TLG8_9PEZI